MILKLSQKVEKILHEVFEFGLLLKFINGIWETLSGLAILFVSKETISKIFYFLASKEMLEDPKDFFIDTSTKFLSDFSHGTQIFIAIYLLTHAFLNLFLCIQLYREKLWAYLANISILVIFIFYQMHRIYIYHSPILIAITIFDIIFIFLTWHEYRHKKECEAFVNI